MTAKTFLRFTVIFLLFYSFAIYSTGWKTEMLPPPKGI